MEETEIRKAVSFEPLTTSPTGSEHDVHMDFSIDIVEDVAAEVEVVMRLSAFGLFREARKAADETLKRYIDYFPVAVEYLRLLYDQGDFAMLRQEAEKFRKRDYRLKDAVPKDQSHFLLLLCDVRKLGVEVPLPEDLQSITRQMNRMSDRTDETTSQNLAADIQARAGLRGMLLTRIERLCAVRTGVIGGTELAELSRSPRLIFEPWPLLTMMVRDFLEKALELCFWPYHDHGPELSTYQIWDLIRPMVDDSIDLDEEQVMGRIGIFLSFCEGVLRRN
ncbi:hypothetical protein LTR49_020274 [Elasticomyces elasticus]|nr:hypothetical protein LTR49_020274 [Elasticomyces elasticus]